ncbi:MAG: phosphoribosylformylglycinamidine synthase subunit PurL [Planctomycetes bacterium]|nr:phosphoribosylformylglycinamidine synthase subunit PurL [Planctomycetota bacterium]
MLWEIEIHPATHLPDREAERVRSQCQSLGAASIRDVRSARSFLIEGQISAEDIARIATGFLVDTVVENHTLVNHSQPATQAKSTAAGQQSLLNVLFKPGVTDNIADSTRRALADLGYQVSGVRTCHKYWFNTDADPADLSRVAGKVLANDAIQQIVWGPLHLANLAVGSDYAFRLVTVAIRSMTDEQLIRLSKEGQLYLSLPEMQTIRAHFIERGKDPTDAELETIAQTWSEHCSHKTLRGRVRYEDHEQSIQFENLLKETVFAATVQVRQQLGPYDWCVSVFQDNAGVVKFDDQQHVCMKVETHNHPSALEPYGGANTGLGGVIRDPLGTGLGARPVCNTDVFCFAPPEIDYRSLPAGVLHPRVIAQGVVSGVRDYGNRMGIPTVNGAVYFDPRYLGNPLVYCGNVAMLPVGKDEKAARTGDYIVAVGGRTGRDGIHGATFSSAELTHESETLSGGAVQIGNAITEKMVLDVILAARDQELYTAITDCGAGGFSSAVGEMGADSGAEVWLEKCPLKYSGLSYTEIWISEAQERMVLSVSPANWEAFERLCRSEGVEATIIGVFTETRQLVLKYHGQEVGRLDMYFLHEGRPPVIRDAVFKPQPSQPLSIPAQANYNDDLRHILASLNVCSKEWIIRQYDHEVQAGSVIKPLVGVACDGPSDAAVVRPDLASYRGLVISNGMNPRYGDLDPYHMAASAIDEAVRNCVAVGADPARVAILDNFCWGNTERPETLGTLVRAALACRDIAVAYGTPFISGKDSLNNEFSYFDEKGHKQTVAIPPSLLISALGQIADIRHAVTMDLKTPGNILALVGATHDELGGSHLALVRGLTGGRVPQVDSALAPRLFRGLHQAISQGTVRSCHDLSEGGLAVAVAEMAFAGGLGADLDLQPLAAQSGLKHDAVLLFSESNTRFLVEVAPAHWEAFKKHLAGLPLVELGKVVAGPQVTIRGVAGKVVVDAPWQELKHAWKAPLAWT